MKRSFSHPNKRICQAKDISNLPRLESAKARRKRTSFYKEESQPLSDIPPQCQTCQRLGLQCQPSEFITRSNWSKPKIERSPTLRRQSTETRDEPLLDQPTSTWDVLSLFPDNSSGETNHTSSTSSSTPADHTFLPTTPQNVLQPAVSIDAETAYLLNQFKTGIATWMDIFDHNCTYQREVSRRALESELIFKCVCAFTAKQLSVVGDGGPVWSTVAARNYGEALKILIQQLSELGPHSDALTAVIMLSSYEMIAAQGQEHRSHYHGAITLVKSLGINAQSSGIDKANFWIYVRHEIFVALGNESPLFFNANEWKVDWQSEDKEEDALGNRLLWLAGQTIDYVFNRDTRIEEAVLLAALESWYAGLSTAFTGVRFGSLTEEGLSQMYFAIPATVPKYRVLFAAGKHVEGITRKMRAWVLLDEVQRKHGFYTHSKVASLQQYTETTMKNRSMA
ncbi:MAG: hypothetical protein Q9227_003254 [Pyrenula ochraceoflavens]